MNKKNEGRNLPSDEISPLAVHGATSAPLARLKLPPAADAEGGNLGRIWRGAALGPMRPGDGGGHGSTREEEREKNREGRRLMT